MGTLSLSRDSRFLRAIPRQNHRYNPIGMIGAIKIGFGTILGGVLLVIGVFTQGVWSLRSKDRRRRVTATLWNGHSRFCLHDRRHRACLEPQRSRVIYPAPPPTQAKTGIEWTTRKLGRSPKPRVRELLRVARPDSHSVERAVHEEEGNQKERGGQHAGDG
jgi:hypothetical protein